MEKLIEIQDYSFVYANTNDIVLNKINLEVMKGEFLAIVGPTGSGKTTLCRSITGIVPQLYQGRSRGRLYVMGNSVDTYTVAELAQNVGYVHQDAESQILMSNIEKEIVFPLENLKLPREEIKERLEYALELVHLADYRHRHPYYLSGGQRQRVVLATALAMKPEVLILDEATSEIDPLGAEEIMRVAKELNDKGMTIIMIEHNLNEMARYSDRIVVMNKGKIEAVDKTRAIFCNKTLLEELCIFPPEISQLFIKLEELGVTLDKIPITIEEGVEELHKCLNKQEREQVV